MWLILYNSKDRWKQHSSYLVMAVQVREHHNKPEHNKPVNACTQSCSKLLQLQHNRSSRLADKPCTRPSQVVYPLGDS